jgi:hypothetical protein
MARNTISPDLNNLNLTCDTAGCNAKATIRILVQSENNKIKSLNLCEKCQNEFFPNCTTTEAILIDDNDVPLIFNAKTRCICHNCDNEAHIFLEAHQARSGYYCEMCSIDLKLHGLAEEVIVG